MVIGNKIGDEYANKMIDINEWPAVEKYTTAGQETACCGKRLPAVEIRLKLV